METFAIEMINISKSFKENKANDNISIRLQKGKIHALLGENGAGKSTLMSILFGLYKADEGIIKINGKEVTINSPIDAQKNGIAMLHQHFQLIENYTVLDNIILGNEDTFGGFITKKKAKERIKDLINKYGLSVNINEKVENLTVGIQQKVEIIKMLYKDSEVLIFDEPTAVLTPKEIQDFLLILKKLVLDNKTILFISHKMNEIFQVANEVTVLRKGKVIATNLITDITKEELSEMMIGRKLEIISKPKYIDRQQVILKINNLYKETNKKSTTLKEISFYIKAGEIVSLAGIDGNGQIELLKCIMGIDSVSRGDIIFDNKNITHASIKKRHQLGISYIPEDRQKYGLILDFDIQNNLILERFTEFQTNHIIKKTKVKEYAQKLIKQYDIRCLNGPSTIVRTMSGGNQQKIIIARELDQNPKLLIAYQPTRGLDIGAIEFIHKNLIKKRNEGCAILIVSHELEEVMALSDRVLVIYEGQIMKEFNADNLNINELGLYMSGVKRSIEVKDE